MGGMSRIHVVCATQPGPNPGMASVDLASRAFLQRHAPRAQVEYHQLVGTAELLASAPNPLPEAARARALERQALPFEYIVSRDVPARLWGADAVLFWGDFLHMEHYLRTAAARLQRIGAARDPESGRAMALDYFFMRQAPEAALRKAIAFGGTLIFDRGLESCGEDYAAAFSRFMGGAHGVWMRDPFSAQKVARERGTLTAPALGCDAALLLDPATVAQAGPRTAWTADDGEGRGAVGAFFGRSTAKVELLAGFAQGLAKSLGAPMHWIPWGTRQSFPLMEYQVRLGKGAPDVDPSLADLLELVGRYRCVVTDTYHLCVTAWKLGVPAICIGEALPRTPNNVNSGWAFAWRDKRQAFYALHDAMDYYVYAEELGAPRVRAQRLGALVSGLQGSAAVSGIAARVRAQAEAAEAALAQGLKALL